LQAEVVERKRTEVALRQVVDALERLKNRLHAENIYLQEEIKTEYNFEEMVGSSPPMQQVFNLIQQVAETDTTVLITGETGTGKELVARALHNHSKRKDSAVIKVNCAALPEGLIENELFGHEKGAFTGATTLKKGRFELADGGTILLDEIGELPLSTQVKLLRVLQEQEFERIGGTKTLKVDVRVLAATNRKLEEQVAAGSFRADLFYRLNIFPIPIPSLRARKADIPVLVQYFLRQFSLRMGKNVNRIDQNAMDILTGYAWPGNVRELNNVIERAVILCQDGVLCPDQLSIPRLPSTASNQEDLITLENAERQHILRALKKTHWVIGGASGAAKRLDINRTTLLARMKKMGIERGMASEDFS
jgi:formate hydrogenlyase transcriptional activator